MRSHATPVPGNRFPVVLLSRFLALSTKYSRCQWSLNWGPNVMMISRRTVILGGLVLLAERYISWPLRGNAPDEESTLNDAVDAYLYGYPLLVMDTMRRQLTNVPSAEPARAPMGQLRRLRTYPAVNDHSVPAPNADTLYTDAWLDLRKEPMVLSVPDMGDRYFMLPMLSGWTNVFHVPGTRTTGEKSQTYVISGPDWSGALPAGAIEYKSPTSIVWMLGRIYCTATPEDYAAVHALQDKMSLVPLSQFGKAYTPPVSPVDPAIDMRTLPRDQVNALGVDEYFKYLAELMKTNPPLPQDGPMIARMASIGLTPGRDFDPAPLRALGASAISDIPKMAMQRMLARFGQLQHANVNGWIFFGPSIASWGTDYELRALCNFLGPGWNLPADAAYPATERGTDGKEYDGNGKYVLRFKRGEMPPVNAFWSLTMYDSDRFFVPNALNRYTISQRDELVANADGSTDIYLQADSPGKDREANWLPAPKGKFSVMLRLYWPKDKPVSILNGTWTPPKVEAAG